MSQIERKSELGLEKMPEVNLESWKEESYPTLRFSHLRGAFGEEIRTN